MNAFLTENQGKVTLEAINVFKLSLLQQGTVGILGTPEGSEKHNVGGYSGAAMRRVSEPAQMRLWNQRFFQVLKLKKINFIQCLLWSGITFVFNIALRCFVHTDASKYSHAMVKL